MLVTEGGSPMSKRIGGRWAIGLAIIALVAGGAAAIASGRIFKKEHRRFHVVTPGVLYRSAALGPEEMSEIIRQFKVKSVVNLRDDVKFAERGLSEKAWVESQGLTYVYLGSLPGRRLERVCKFLEVVTDPKYQPVLVHCHQGLNATGFAVAAYRICAEGWCAEDACDEMVKLGAKHSYAEEHRPFFERLTILQRSKHFPLRNPPNRSVARKAPTSQAPVQRMAD